MVGRKSWRSGDVLRGGSKLLSKQAKKQESKRRGWDGPLRKGSWHVHLRRCPWGEKNGAAATIMVSHWKEKKRCHTYKEEGRKKKNSAVCTGDEKCKSGGEKRVGEPAL